MDWEGREVEKRGAEPDVFVWIEQGASWRLSTTQVGEIRLTRIYCRLVKCGTGSCPVDERLGLVGRYSPNAQRLICLPAGCWSYDVSSERLEELCGLNVLDTTIREVAQSPSRPVAQSPSRPVAQSPSRPVAQEHGARVNEWLRTEPKAVQEFREATGDVEFTTDGTCVNATTTTGWREMKVGIFSKGDRSEPAAAEDWESRRLPAPKIRIAFAAIADCESFGSRWKALRAPGAPRLGLADTSAVTVQADGAKWIWEQQREHLRNAEGVLDIFHAQEHLSALGMVLHADPTAQQAWLDRARETLLHHGWAGTETFASDQNDAWPASATGPASARTPAQQAAVDARLDELSPHEHHLHYAQRLAEGRSIGSGQIEGACKNLIGWRLKANAARWRVSKVNRMAGLCSLLYSQQWHTSWETP